MNKRLRTFVLIAAAVLALSGCGKSAEPVSKELPSEKTAVSIPETAEPQEALDEIYKTIDVDGVEEGSGRVLRDKFNINTDLLNDYYFNYTNGRFGVADVFILEPVDGEGAKVREALEQVKLSRSKEFENYDIYNAYQIAQDAVIFEQGDYLILLMLEDPDAARTIIDKYIPK